MPFLEPKQARKAMTSKKENWSIKSEVFQETVATKQCSLSGIASEPSDIIFPNKRKFERVIKMMTFLTFCNARTESCYIDMTLIKFIFITKIQWALLCGLKGRIIHTKDP